MSACTFCDGPGGDLLWSDTRCRVVLVAGEEASAFPGFCRVIWNHHLAEMSELAPTDAMHLMTIICRVELALRDLIQPDKINLASLGNLVPHLHWHIIPRWRDDSHFPRPVWAEPLRPALTRPRVDAAMLRSALSHANYLGVTIAAHPFKESTG